MAFNTSDMHGSGYRIGTFMNFAPAQSGAVRSGNFFASLIGMIATWNDVRATRKSLSALTDRELNDIGLSRADIDAAARR
ncbi:DUF1127 domain-containing protein [Sagittula sp. SSi028]|uniref:DUF1127 domain-containing protein n=1 Tax=Sagittula sp. SSi028 TaxID=3400636 RepID=UPI003AF569EB